LGHYFLPGHIDAVFANGNIHQSEAGFTSADPCEMEADQFAAGLLMPSGPFKRLLARRDPGLATIEHVAHQCRTSLTATAIRCADLTSDAVAIAISTGPTIDHCFMSETKKSLPDLSWLRKGTAVPVGTATATSIATAPAFLQGTGWQRR
jgi:Zn-dependent peptidase ImmA (M78 family)